MVFVHQMLFILLSLVIGLGYDVAEAQNLSGSGPSSIRTSETVDNACRGRVNDLRIGIGSLRDDINLIRACSANGQLAMRVGNAIVCRDVTQGHHVWDVTKTDIRFATGPNTFGGNKNLMGPQGDPGRNVRCEPCAESWVDPICPSGHTGSYTAWQTCSSGVAADCEACYGPAQQITQTCSCALPGTWQGPSCPPGFTGTHTALQTCSAFGQCCGSAPMASVQCCAGSVCVPGANCEACTTGGVNGWWWNGNCVTTQPASCISPPLGNDCDRCPANGSPTGGWLLGGVCRDTQPMECSGGGSCPNAEWQTGDWSACSAGTCAAGMQSRTVSCICPSTGNPTTGCNVNIRPTNIQACDTYTYGFSNDWSTCNGGTQTRPCLRCDGATATCSQCGGNCPSQSCDVCQTPGTCFWTCTTGGEVGNFCRFYASIGPNGMMQSRISCSARGTLHPDDRFGGEYGSSTLPAGPGARARAECPSVNHTCDPVHARCLPANP